MKRILFAVIALVVIGASSCKKEDGVKPETNNTETVLNKKDTQQWD